MSVSGVLTTRSGTIARNIADPHPRLPHPERDLLIEQEDLQLFEVVGEQLQVHIRVAAMVPESSARSDAG